MEKMFQEIYDLFEYTFPEKWKKIVFYVIVCDGVREVKYYVKTQRNEFIECFSLDNTDHLIIRMMNALEVVIKNREDDWSVMTLVLESDGAFHSTFDYSDEVLNFEDYMTAWKEKYLV